MWFREIGVVHSASCQQGPRNRVITARLPSKARAAGNVIFNPQLCTGAPRSGGLSSSCARRHPGAIALEVSSRSGTIPCSAVEKVRELLISRSFRPEGLAEGKTPTWWCSPVPPGKCESRPKDRARNKGKKRSNSN